MENAHWSLRLPRTTCEATLPSLDCMTSRATHAVGEKTSVGQVAYLPGFSQTACMADGPPARNPHQALATNPCELKTTKSLVHHRRRCQPRRDAKPTEKSFA
eukprot:6196229-Pleurochrysis_carterae.AAC.2